MRTAPRGLPIGQRVAFYRTERGYSQTVLAERVGRTKSWLDKVELGRRDLDRLSVIKALAGVLRVSPLVLLFEDLDEAFTRGSWPAGRRPGVPG